VVVNHKKKTHCWASQKEIKLWTVSKIIIYIYIYVENPLGTGWEQRGNFMGTTPHHPSKDQKTWLP
jgi:hypothetical protein